jgi:hypothetical protein
MMIIVARLYSLDDFVYYADAVRSDFALRIEFLMRPRRAYGRISARRLSRPLLNFALMIDYDDESQTRVGCRTPRWPMPMLPMPRDAGFAHTRRLDGRSLMLLLPPGKRRRLCCYLAP